jgi:hypothetical protein
MAAACDTEIGATWTLPVQKPKDGLVRLPDNVAADLLTAWASIDAAMNDRLVLQRVGYRRPPCTHGDGDYNVMRRGKVIGRIWRHEYTRHPWEGLGPWHWDWRINRASPWSEGHAPTLEAAMADFRTAWDSRTHASAVR